MNKNEYVLTSDGYKKALAKLKRLQEEYDANGRAISKTIQDATGDGPHDNGEFDALQAKEQLLVSQINRLTKQIEAASIIDIPKLSDNQVNIGDYILLKLIYDDDEEMQTYQLVGGDGDPNLNQVSLNAPIGKAVFKAKVGEKKPFIVNDHTFYVEIVEKIKHDG